MLDGGTSKSTVVESNRIIYTPSNFAKNTLFHIQEIGNLQAKKPHISRHTNLDSYLFIIINSGSGILHYNDQDYVVNKGNAIFIDCNLSYYHSTSDDLWNISWIHFNGPTAKEIYMKYIERGGLPVFSPNDQNRYLDIYNRLYNTVVSTDYVRDMKINTGISDLLSVLMIDSWHPEANTNSNKSSSLDTIRKYIYDNYNKKITLDEIAESHYINKYYLTRIFKQKYGISINSYITNLRITNAKKELRFSDKSIEQIGIDNGYKELYYFSRMFKQVEGISPQQYRMRWK